MVKKVDVVISKHMLQIIPSMSYLLPLPSKCWHRYIASDRACVMAYVRETVQYRNQSSSLPIKIQTAYDILQPYKLSFDIPQIDKCLNLTDRAGGTSSLCITNSSVRDGGSSSWQQRHVNDILVTRLCVRALLSRRQGGFESPAIIFIDAGNCSDIYQCVNFARQYGLDIQKVMDSIIVSRPFNIYQLAGLLIDELDPAVVKERFGAKLVVISDLLKMFTPQQDSQIEPDESLWLVKEIARSLRRLTGHVLLVVSIRECPAQYRRLLLPLFDNKMHIATRPTNEPGRCQVKVATTSSLHNRHDDFDGKSQSSSSSFIITERDMMIIPPR
jgi:hypothetical protein